VSNSPQVLNRWQNTRRDSLDVARLIVASPVGQLSLFIGAAVCAVLMQLSIGRLASAQTPSSSETKEAGDAKNSAFVRYDTVLIGGTIHRGDGSEPYIGHVAIHGGRIAAISTTVEPKGAIRIDCAGLVVAPGFIDLHNHSDEPILKPNTRSNINYLMQGCTTIVTGNCGSGHVDVAKYLASVDADGAGTHVAHLLPQGSLRRTVVGSGRRDPTEAELAKMLALADRAMRDGAFGMSTGLIYIPGTLTPTHELIEVAKVVGSHGGIYASHIRNEGSALLESVGEAIEIGRQANLPVHISHIKASGKSNWGSLRLAIQSIDQARQAGLVITADQYPYAASSTSLEATLFPSWASEGGRSELRKRLADPQTAARIRSELVAKLAGSSRIQLVSCSYNPQWIGKSLEEVAASEQVELADLVITIQTNGGASVINFGMSEDDMRMAMPLAWVATASDGNAKVPSSSMPHPRSFGTFPRKIGRYAIGEKVMSLAAAIRSCSGLPAEILGLPDRGQIVPQLAADLVVFDPNRFLDQATYDEPYLPTLGIKHVLVDGGLAVYEGQPTGLLAGRALRKPMMVSSVR